MPCLWYLHAGPRIQRRRFNAHQTQNAQVDLPSCYCVQWGRNKIEPGFLAPSYRPISALGCSVNLDDRSEKQIGRLPPPRHRGFRPNLALYVDCEDIAMQFVLSNKT